MKSEQIIGYIYNEIKKVFALEYFFNQISINDKPLLLIKEIKFEENYPTKVNKTLPLTYIHGNQVGNIKFTNKKAIY